MLENDIIGLLRIESMPMALPRTIPFSSLVCQGKNLSVNSLSNVYVVAEFFDGLPVHQTESTKKQPALWASSFQSYVFCWCFSRMCLFVCLFFSRMCLFVFQSYVFVFQSYGLVCFSVVCVCLFFQSYVFVFLPCWFKDAERVFFCIWKNGIWCDEVTL
jgi:hypothetical protein